MRRKVVFLPYDFDTALGINNEGALVFGYALEDTDKTESGVNVFNGQDSVFWKNLRDAYCTEIADMYKTLRQKGILSYDRVEKAFEEHQAKWPEAVFNEDAYYKYLLPLIQDGDGTYLEMLQGSKDQQRKWWLYNRFRYMDSKYNAGDALTDVITLRAYAKADIAVTPYADVYATIRYGSYLVQERASRNSQHVLACPVDAMDDTEVYIYSASQLSDVGDLSPLYVGFADFSRAIRLTNLKLGDADSSFINTNMRALTLGNNTLLKKLDVRGCMGLGTYAQKAVDLSGCSGLEEAYFDRTQIQGVSLPNGGPLKVLHLPCTMTSLILRNLTALTDFSLAGAENLSTLRLENMPSCIDSRALLMGMPVASRVRLSGIYWEMADEDEILQLMDHLDGLRGLDEQGNNMDTAQVAGTLHVDNLTGAGLARMEGRYPYLAITFDHITSVLTYCTYDGSEVLHTETITDGGNGSWDDRVPREEDNYGIYTFIGWTREPRGEIDESALDHVLSDRTVYAAYYVTEKYNICYFTYDGASLLKVETLLECGGDGKYPGRPERPDDDDYYYDFVGWSRAPEGEADPDAQKNITHAIDLYAVYRKVPKIRVTYCSYDGSEVIFTETLRGTGRNGTYTGIPERQMTAKHEYTFVGWSMTRNAEQPEEGILLNVQESMTVYAVYSVSLRHYNVRFYNGTVLLETVSVPYGDTAVFSGEEPHSSEEDYLFTGWDPLPVYITRNTDVYAQFVDTGNMVVKYLRKTLTEYVSENDGAITEGAFCSLPNLVRVQSGANEVANSAFSNCRNLEEVVFTNENMTMMRFSAFDWAPMLSRLLLYAKNVLTTHPQSTNVQCKGIKNATVFVPSNLLEAYRTDIRWKDSMSIVPLDQYPEMGMSPQWDEVIVRSENHTISENYALDDRCFFPVDQHMQSFRLAGIDMDSLSSDPSQKAGSTWLMELTYHQTRRFNPPLNAVRRKGKSWIENENGEWISQIHVKDSDAYGIWTFTMQTASTLSIWYKTDCDPQAKLSITVNSSKVVSGMGGQNDWACYTKECIAGEKVKVIGQFEKNESMNIFSDTAVLRFLSTGAMHIEANIYERETPDLLLSSGGGAGGYEVSELDTWLNTEFLQMIPEKIRVHIKPVIKEYWDGSSLCMRKCERKIWIPSAREIGLNVGDEEGITYPVFTDDTSRKLRSRLESSYETYFTRTVADLHRIIGFAGHGKLLKYDATTKADLMIGFCI